MSVSAKLPFMDTSQLQPGQGYEYDIDVTPDMRAGLGLGELVVHELYSTSAMLAHLEWAARQVLLPALAPDEEACGYKMTIEHRHPTPFGQTVHIAARLTGVETRRKPDGRHTVLVTCHCTAHVKGTLVGQADVVQAVLPRSVLRSR
ncbi:MAG: hypothetical protein KC474_11590 [Cyanobacteria bacterium HKST-UBA04]|nr:hypothetical protein [Cyanobacteria bacterium HKST-UBA04]